MRGSFHFLNKFADITGLVAPVSRRHRCVRTSLSVMNSAGAIGVSLDGGVYVNALSFLPCLMAFTPYPSLSLSSSLQLSCALSPIFFVCCLVLLPSLSFLPPLLLGQIGCLARWPFVLHDSHVQSLEWHSLCVWPFKPHPQHSMSLLCPLRPLEPALLPPRWPPLPLPLWLCRLSCVLYARSALPLVCSIPLFVSKYASMRASISSSELPDVPISFCFNPWSLTHV